MIQIAYSVACEIIPGAFVVDVLAADRRWFQHNGPAAFAYFTEAEAGSLVAAVRRRGAIDPQFWTDGAGGFYGTEAHELALIEAEAIEGDR